MERYKISKVGDKWTCVDLFNQIVCTFDENNFNGSQHYDFPPDIMVGKMANDLAKIINEMAAWLRKHHYSLVMPRDTDIKVVVGCTFRDTRIKRHMTQQEVADRCGLTQTHIARIEAAKYNTTIDVVDKVAQALGVYVKIVDYGE